MRVPRTAKRQNLRVSAPEKGSGWSPALAGLRPKTGQSRDYNKETAGRPFGVVPRFEDRDKISSDHAAGGRSPGRRGRRARAASGWPVPAYSPRRRWSGRVVLLEEAPARRGPALRAWWAARPAAAGCRARRRGAAAAVPGWA